MNSVAWLWILFGAGSLLSSFALESSQLVRGRDFLVSSNHPSQSDPEEEHGTCTEGALEVNKDCNRRKLVASENITSTAKAKKGGGGSAGRGKGSNGAANVVHREPGKKNAAVALFYTPYFAISLTILGFSFSMLLTFPFPLS